MKPSFFPVRLPGIRLRRLLQGFLWVSIVLLLSCKQEKEDLTIVKFYGNGSVSDLTMSFLMHSTPCLPGKAGGLAMNSGDILVIEDWLLPFDDALLSKDG
ncbi:MAG TPA: hypothetical protein VK907_09670, partial [Phnomibacter sp.]|nr:hypothetical protein [Phnomibacter sp.]